MLTVLLPLCLFKFVLTKHCLCMQRKSVHPLLYFLNSLTFVRILRKCFCMSYAIAFPIVKHWRWHFGTCSSGGSLGLCLPDPSTACWCHSSHSAVCHPEYYYHVNSFCFPMYSLVSMFFKKSFLFLKKKVVFHLWIQIRCIFKTGP